MPLPKQNGTSSPSRPWWRSIASVPFASRWTAASGRDSWDGYPAARKRLFEAIRHHEPANLVIISGDVHAFYAADLRPDFIRPVSTSNPVIASEFCGTSTTSSSRPQSRTDRYVSENPHIQYGRSDRRGFAMGEIIAKKMTVHFMGLENVLRPDSPVSALASFVVEDGKPGVQRS